MVLGSEKSEEDFLLQVAVRVLPPRWTIGLIKLTVLALSTSLRLCTTLTNTGLVTGNMTNAFLLPLEDFFAQANSLHHWRSGNTMTTRESPSEPLPSLILIRTREGSLFLAMINCEHPFIVPTNTNVWLRFVATKRTPSKDPFCTRATQSPLSFDPASSTLKAAIIVAATKRPSVHENSPLLKVNTLG